MGSVVISVDAELGWGFHDLPSPPGHRIEAARAGWRRLLALFEEYQIPATWAVVGHLFLEDCDGVHADHPTPPSWFERERSDWRDRPDLRFGGDLIGDLVTSEVSHDVGCHTYSHVVFDQPWVDREVVDAELEAAMAASRAAGVEPRSFVFPRNVVGFRDRLAAHGFSVYRSEGNAPSSTVARGFDKLASAVDPGRVRIVEPTVDEYGLVDVPPSMFLFGFEGRGRDVLESIWTDPVVAQARLGIERAATEDGVFHLWAHPNNLVDERDVRRMDAVLELVDRYQTETPLSVETMADVAERFR